MTKNELKLLRQLRRRKQFNAINSKEFSDLLGYGYIESLNPIPGPFGANHNEPPFRVSKLGEKQINDARPKRNPNFRSNLAIGISIAALLISLFANLDKIIENVAMLLKWTGLMQ